MRGSEKKETRQTWRMEEAMRFAWAQNKGNLYAYLHECGVPGDPEELAREAFRRVANAWVAENNPDGPLGLGFDVLSLRCVRSAFGGMALVVAPLAGKAESGEWLAWSAVPSEVEGMSANEAMSWCMRMMLGCRCAE